MTNNENNDDEPSVITKGQLDQLFAALGESYAPAQINQALSETFKMGFLERNAVHHSVLEIVRNAESNDEVGKEIAAVVNAVLAEKIEAFKQALYDSGSIVENVKKQIGKVRRRG